MVTGFLLAMRAADADTAGGLADFSAGRFAEALSQWREAAAQGDSRAALFVGVLHDTGFGVVQDEAQALEWYRRAADAGSAAGAFNAGVMYDAGRGTVADPQQAAAWYARAAAKDYPRAEFNLAMLYEAGIGVPRDRLLAVEFFRKAAKHGITAARAHLAAYGQAQERPVRPVEGPMSDVPMQTFRQAQRAFLARGPEQAAHAVELFRAAAEQRNALAEYDLGYCYEHGIGVPRDLVQASRWYRGALNDAKDDAVRGIAEAGAQSLAGVHNQAALHNPEHP